MPSIDSNDIERYQSLNKETKQRIHFILLKIIDQRALETTYDLSEIKGDKVTRVSPHKLELLLNLLISKALAQVDDDSLYCHFGGWTSTFNSQGECRAPWSSAVRKDEDLLRYGPTYTSAYSCGGAQLFRCNPILYGASDTGDPLGECVVTNDRQTEDASKDCFDSFQGNAIRVDNFFKELENDPAKLAQYLGVVAETIRFCRVKKDDFSFCSELESFFKIRTHRLMSCYQQEELYNFLPEIVTPFNQEELNQVAHNLGHNFLTYFEELKEREQKVRERNLALYQQAFDQFSSDPRTVAINERMQDNATRCLLGTCTGTKPANVSKSKCARYVKLGLFPVRGGLTYADQSKPWNRQYPWSKDAVESGPWLEEMGYENAMDIDELAYLTPENAPVGSIIVYEDTTPSRNYNVAGEVIGGPGHIEIKTGGSEYISDFKTSSPTRIGGARVPIGIYIQIPQEIKTQIATLPGS